MKRDPKVEEALPIPNPLATMSPMSRIDPASEEDFVGLVEMICAEAIPLVWKEPFRRKSPEL